MRVIDNLRVQLCISSKISWGLPAPEPEIRMWKQNFKRQKKRIVTFWRKCKCTVSSWWWVTCIWLAEMIFQSWFTLNSGDRGLPQRLDLSNFNCQKSIYTNVFSLAVWFCLWISNLKIKISQDRSDATEEVFLVPQRTIQWTVLKGKKK